MVSPTRTQLWDAFKDHGVRFRVHPRERSRNQWVDGLAAVVMHHTAGKNSVDYLVSSWSLPGANCVLTNGRYNDTDGEAVILAWGSCFHSGTGGPWPGVARADSLHFVAWGIEVESLGTVTDITDSQVETAGRMCAALIDLGVPADHLVRHADWTDGSGGVGGFPLPTRGRKIDTNAGLGYTTQFWRDAASKYRKVEGELTPEQMEQLADMVADRVWRRKWREYVDQDGNGVRDERTASDILFATHKAAVEAAAAVQKPLEG